MALTHRECEITSDDAGRVDRVVQRLTGLSRGWVRGLFDQGCVRVNGAVCSEAGALVTAGERVEVRYDPHTRYHELPRPARSNVFRLMFEDPHLIVVDKAASVLTVPSERGESNTLVDALRKYLAHQKGRPRPQVVHRLDRGTSGLLVFAKQPQIAIALQDQFRAHATQREYAAIVRGVLTTPEGAFESYLATNKQLTRYSARRPGHGERAVTHYRVEQPLSDATLVRVWLETGRRNQIRVHFAEAGHPVLGEDRYRTELSRHPLWTAKRLALHARVLGFVHPVTRKPTRFESPLPTEFTRFVQKATLPPSSRQ